MPAISIPSLLIYRHRPRRLATAFSSIRHLKLSLFSHSTSPSSLCVESSAQSPAANAGSGRSGSLAAPPPQLDGLQKIEVNPPKGTRDFPPEDMRLRSWLFQNFREVSQLFGFEEVDFPVLESEALFIRKAGEEIRDQVIVPDFDLRVFFVSRKSVPLPLKWFAIGQCWRYERMTRGRRREHYQWNMDIIGVPDVTAEAELISSIITFFKRIGITSMDVGFKVSSRKVLQDVLRCYSVPENMFSRLEKIPIEDIKKELKSAELSDVAIEELLQVLSVKSLEKLEEKLGTDAEALADLKKLFSLAEKYGYSEWIQFDASVVRGLAYYTGIVFEGFDREGKLRAICGGGRYDKLLSTFGGDDLPACGFGFGDAVIVELLKEKGLVPELSLQVDNIVCSLDPDLQGAASSVATILREKGQSILTDTLILDSNRV
nr:histidine--tRNA ligase, chloroplastic/mitochondrial [Ipomoea batatas]